MNIEVLLDVALEVGGADEVSHELGELRLPSEEVAEVQNSNFSDGLQELGAVEDLQVLLYSEITFFWLEK